VGSYSDFNSCMVFFLNHRLGLPHIEQEQKARLSASLLTDRLQPHLAVTTSAFLFIRSRL